MVLNPPELSLKFKPTYIPKSISTFLGELYTIGSVSERLLKLEDFVKRLEEEMRKIDAFKRELPLCMILLDDAIVVMKEELIQCRKSSNVGPVVEEFIPLKKNCSEDDEKGENRQEKYPNRDKMDWLRSVPLWNSTPDYPKTTDVNYNRKPNPLAEIKKRVEEKNGSVANDLYEFCKTRTPGRAFLPFKGYPALPVVATRKEDKDEGLPLPGLSLDLLTPGIKNPMEDLGSCGLGSKTSSSRSVSSSSAPNGQSNLLTGPQPPNQQSSRKQRRCWSPELHRRFVNTLSQLGGPQVATPKQIRELMQVDGLTNDEVKSHLQKYRLHTRRAPATGTSANQSGLGLGGLLPQDQCGESSSKHSTLQSGSPQGPLQLTGTTGGTSTTGVDSMDNEDDERSESYSWKSHIHTTRKDDV